MKKILLLYFVFSLLYCFALTDRFHYNLSDDNVTVASVCMRDSHPEIFKNDSLKFNEKDYYLPGFTRPVSLIWSLAGSYVTALQILLFAVMFPTLCFTHVLLRGMFGEIGEWKAAAGTLFLNMILFYAPSGEMTGFGGLHSALARYVCGIFLPLLALLYYKDSGVRIGRFGLSTMSALGLASGLLVNIHPPSAVTAYAILGTHWLVFRSGIFKDVLSFRRAVVTGLKSGILFSAGALSYAASYISMTYTLSGGLSTPATAAASSHGAVAASGKLSFFFLQKLGWVGMAYFLDELFFLPFLIPFLFFAFFKTGVEDRRLCFFRQVILVGFPICAGGLLLRILVNLGPFFYPFQRADRFLIFVVSLGVVWFLFFGRRFFKGRTAFVVFSLGLLFFWIGGSMTKGRFHYDFLGCGMDGQVEGLLFNSVTGFSVLLLILAFKSGLLDAGRFSRAARALLISVFVIFPIFSGGLILLAAHVLDSLNGVGAWRLAALATGSRAYEKMKCFEDAAAWARKNTPYDALFMYFDPSKGVHMKISAMRRGVGSEYELGTTPEDYYTLRDLYEAAAEDRQGWRDTVSKLMGEGLQPILGVSGRHFKKPVKKLDGFQYAMSENSFRLDKARGLKNIYSNKFYTIYKKEKTE